MLQFNLINRLFINCLEHIDIQASFDIINHNYVLVCRWRRQTRLRQVGASGGLRGDVYYFAPCGKKLRTYPEVTRVSMGIITTLPVIT